jgi:hypothetical protein
MGDLLLEMGLLDERTLEDAIVEQRASGRRLPRILGEKRVLDEERLTKAVAAKLRLEVVNVTSLKIHERVLALIPAPVAFRYGVLPIAIKRANGTEYLYLVMADPLDNEAIEEVQRVTQKQVRVLMATASDVDQAIDAQYRALHAKPSMPVTTPSPTASAQAPRPAPQPAPAATAPPKPQPPKPQPPARSASSHGSEPAASRPPLPPLSQSKVPRPAGATPAKGTPSPTKGTPAPKIAPKPLLREVPPPTPPPPPQLQRRVTAKPEQRELAGDLELVRPSPLEDPGQEQATRIEGDRSFGERSVPEPQAQADWDLAVRDWGDRPADLGQPAGKAQSNKNDPVTTEASVSGGVEDYDEPFEVIEIDSGELRTGQVELELSEAQIHALQAAPVHLAGSPRKRPEPLPLELPVEVDDPHHPFAGPGVEEIPTGLEKTGIIPAIDWEKEGFDPPPLADRRVSRSLADGDIPLSKEAATARQVSERRQVPAPAASLDFVAALDAELEGAKKRRRPEIEVGQPGSQPEDSDADAMPVIEPSSLVSLIDEHESEDTGSDHIPKVAARAPVEPAPPPEPPRPEPTRLFDESNRAVVSTPVLQREEEPTNPRIDTSSVKAMLAEKRALDQRAAAAAAAAAAPPVEAPAPAAPDPIEDVERTPSKEEEVERDAVLLALDGQFTMPEPKAPAKVEARPDAPEADHRSRELVAALMQGRSLSSAERAELVLAVGRLLVRSGVFDGEDLARELMLDAGRR